MVPSPSPKRRQAVLVIHGIGNQRPMDTLASFVAQIWGGDPTRMWYRPDSRSKNFDLFQVVAYDEDTRTDFYELYWAHLMEGTRFYSVWRWFLHNLLNRDTADMPAPMAEAKAWINRILALVLGLYTAAVIVLLGRILLALDDAYTIAACVVLIPLAAFLLRRRRWRSAGVASAYAAALACLPWLRPALEEQGALALATALAAATVVVLTAILSVLDRRMISPVIGDAARYLRNDPENVAARQSIRALGVDALERLHRSDRHYDRIVVVGHSLGSIIGYDILRYAFSRRLQEVKVALAALPPEVGAFDAACADPGDRRFRGAQHDLCRVVGGVPIGPHRAEKAWIVTDFVTLGSPLAYANILLAETEEDFQARLDRRLLPTCPPRASDAPNEQGMRGFYAWLLPGGQDAWAQPHHGAVFAFTRWTNLYFPARRVIQGDIIGGPIAPVLGRGVKDVAIDCTHLRGRGYFSHTSYWSPDGLRGVPDHITAVRLALNLDGPDTAADLPASTCAPPT